MTRWDARRESAEQISGRLGSTFLAIDHALDGELAWEKLSTGAPVDPSDTVALERMVSGSVSRGDFGDVLPDPRVRVDDVGPQRTDRCHGPHVRWLSNIRAAQGKQQPLRFLQSRAPARGGGRSDHGSSGRTLAAVHRCCARHRDSITVRWSRSFRPDHRPTHMAAR
jgi:hypothetical protein